MGEPRSGRLGVAERCAGLTRDQSNIGVLQTTVAELVSVKEHQRTVRARWQWGYFSDDLSPCVLCDAFRMVFRVRLGAPPKLAPLIVGCRSIIGPALGGALAQPRLSYPNIIPEGSFFDRFPFLLPNLACTVILVCGVTIGILFLKETHEDLKHRRDYGLELGELILRRVSGKPPKPRVELPLDKARDACLEETISLIDDDDDLPPGYRTSEGSLQSSRTPSPSKHGRSRKPRAAKTAFTKQVIMNIVGYGILAL